MRFTSDGPSIPDELLIARDTGDVIFFCGAGVSRARANLPDFLTLGSMVLEKLGASKKSLASKLFDKAKAVGGMAGVGGLIATDRIFSLLEREFEVADVRAAVAEAITPVAGVDCSAHRIMLDLSTGRDGTVRLVTTNFDLLFEACDAALRPFGPPTLPDPRGANFGGIVHIHGRVDADYRGPADEEFVVSSGDFGRAYLSDGWATRFMQSLLARFQIVFVGYTADDPPMQYLLEALRLRAGTRSRLYAFQDGLSPDAIALWEHRGVQAIPFDSSKGYGPLWQTLEAWAHRARDVDGWYDQLLTEAYKGPEKVSAHVRGQIAHMLSTRNGAHRIATAQTPIPATWLLMMDPTHRYGRPGPVEPNDESSDRFDPYEVLALDSDTPPKPINEDGCLAERKIPDDAWDAFAPMRADREDSAELPIGQVRGRYVREPTAMPHRLASIGIWLQRVSQEPVTLWWAAQQDGLHARIIDNITNWIGRDPNRFPAPIKQGWRLLMAAWADQRLEPDRVVYDLKRRVPHDGWNLSMVRAYVDSFRPRLTIREPYGIRHPLAWTKEETPSPPILADVGYPHPHELLELPANMLGYAVSLFRANLELAKALEREIRGDDWLHFETTRADDAAAAIGADSYGLTGPIAHFQTLMARYGELDPDAARAEISRWPSQDDGIFARLRIWASGSQLLDPEAATRIFLGLSDRVFWGSMHQRDLLFALRDRWLELAQDQRASIEQRLRTGSYPWDEKVRGGPAAAQAHYRLDRLKWLADQGVMFSFDLTAEMESLRALAPEWSEHSAAAAADSHAPVVRSIETDPNPSRLEKVPISEILAKAQSAENDDFWGFVEPRPFSGLANEQPARAFAALRHAAKNGEVPGWAWSTFLQAQTRKQDRKRLSEAVATQLCRLTAQELRPVAYPVTEWMVGLAPRLYDDLASILAPLWDHMIEALRLGGEDRATEVDSSWANDALNAPVGKLVDVLMKDPAIQKLAIGTGLPPSWWTRADQLLALPGDMRRHALVMIAFHTNWLHAVDPQWVERQLLSAADLDDPDGDAFWDGLLWRAHAPSRVLFERIKPALMRRALERSRRRSEATIMGGFLLIGWGGDSNVLASEQLITSEEFREILVDADDDLRSQTLWQLQQWSKPTDSRWQPRVLPFFRDVWPRHRALRTPELSSRLADFAFESGELFPEIVAVIASRLVPVRGGFSRIAVGDGPAENHPGQRYPAAMLDLLWAILAEDASQWPYKIEEVLDMLEAAPETRADPRLSELRRRRSR